MERGSGTRISDLLEYPGQVVVDSIDGESDHRQAAILEVIIAFGVIFALLLVNRPVNLDHKARSWAREIDDVRTDRMLPTKLPAIEAMISEHLPKAPLTRRDSATEIPRRFAAPEPPSRTAPLIIHHGAINSASLGASNGSSFCHRLSPPLHRNGEGAGGWG